MSSSSSSDANQVRLALPKGRMKDGVFALLGEAGISVKVDERGYRPTINLDTFNVKLLKPQNIIEMLAAHSRDLGFGGADWVENLGCTDKLIRLLDTKLDPVKVVAAGPALDMLSQEYLNKLGRPLIVATEYEKLTRDWIARKGLNATIVKSYGATESFPPEDADLIVDNCSTGNTLKANGLHVLDVVFESSTGLYTHPDALKDPSKKKVIEEFVLLLQSVLDARTKVMVTFNISEALFKGDDGKLVKSLPCMRAPSISQLYQQDGYAVSICVEKKLLPTLLPQLKGFGATDIVVAKVQQILA